MSFASWLRMWAISCGDHSLKLLAAKELQQTLSHRNVGVLFVHSGGECVGVGVGDDPDSWLGEAGCDRHLLHHVDQPFFPELRGFDEFPGSGCPEDFLRTLYPAMPR